MKLLISLVLAFFVAITVAEVRVSELRPERYIPIGDKSLKLSTVAHSTRTLFWAIKNHDFASILNHVSKRSIFFVHSLLPGSGVYQGKFGFIEMNKHWMDTVHVNDFSYRILYVDEARGKSVVECRSSGIFRHNNVAFDSTVRIFMKWTLGKIDKLNLVEMNPNKMYNLFQTMAEKQWFKIMEAMYRCGGCSDVNKYIADDVIVHLENIYPLSLISNATEGKDLNVALKGRDSLLKLADFADKTYFDITQHAGVLYSDNTTVVAAKLLLPGKLADAIFNKKMYWKYATIMYTINKFDERGLLKEARLFLNRPMSPWTLRKLDQQLLEYSNTTLNNLLEPLKKVLTISQATETRQPEIRQPEIRQPEVRQPHTP